MKKTNPNQLTFIFEPVRFPNWSIPIDLMVEIETKIYTHNEKLKRSHIKLTFAKILRRAIEEESLS